jgi:hypothetical protein
MFGKFKGMFWEPKQQKKNSMNIGSEMLPYLDIITEWRTRIPVTKSLLRYLISDFTRGVQNSIPPPLHMPEHDEQWTDEHARTHQCLF